jgi:hypothetical protein
MKIVSLFFALCCMTLALNSCLGVQADITIRADGSGKIALEYRVSQILESIGRLDGNERWPAIPVGKGDFERSVARIPGLKLTSFSSKDVRRKQGEKDLLTKVTLEFKNTDALLAFLDSTGNTRATLVQENGKNILRLTLLSPSSAIANPDLLSLLGEISAGYEINLSLSAPKTASLAVPPSVPAARLVSQGKKVSFAAGLTDIIGLNEGLVIEISW